MIIGNNFYIDNIFIYLLALGVLGIIYIAGGEEAKRIIKIFFMKTWMFLLIGGILIYGWNKWGIVADTQVGQMHTALGASILIFLIYLAGVNWLYELRYHTTPFQACGIYGSCSRYYAVGRFTVFYLGTTGKSYSKGFMLNWNIPNKIVIIPTSQWYFNGESIYALTKVSKRMFEQVPSPMIKNAIISDSMTFMAREEIYIGFFREKDLMDNPYLEDTEERLLDMGIMDTIEKEMIQGKNNTMKKHVTDIKGIEKKLTNQTTYTQPQPMSNEGA